MNIKTTFFSFRARLQPKTPVDKKGVEIVLPHPWRYGLVFLTALILSLQFLSTKATAQVYTETFTSGVTPTTAQATNWNAFRAALLATNPYYKCKISTSSSSTYVECTNATIVQDIALKLRTGVAATWVDGANTWNVGVCAVSGTEWELSVNNSGNCSCGAGWAVRPAIGNFNWGGFTTTCSAPTQTMTVEFFYGTPCTPPSSLNATNIASTSATVSWNPVTPSVNYEYVVNTTSVPSFSMTGTVTTFTSRPVTGLLPNTQYYLHVKNTCSTNSVSAWVTYPFKTNPPCDKRAIRVRDVTNKSAVITWNKEAHGSEYEYMYKKDPVYPTSSTSTTLDSFFKVDNLPEGTKYYVFVRMKCPGGELSPWALDSFVTRTICRQPTLEVTHVNQERAVISWQPMPTAVKYEYEVSMSPTPLGKGTEILNNSFLAFPLKDGQVYYFHVKSKCDDQGFISESDWATTSFKTFPTSVANTTGNQFLISAYPNPVKDQLVINVSGQVTGAAQLNITDINGRTVHTTGVENNTATIDMSKLSAGLYFVKYSDAVHTEMIKITKK